MSDVSDVKNEKQWGSRLERRQIIRNEVKAEVKRIKEERERGKRKRKERIKETREGRKE